VLAAQVPSLADMRRFHEDEREARVRDDVAAPVQISRAARMLALQRTVGNHAVAAMLAREAAPKQEPVHTLAIVEGLGTIPLESAALGEVQKGGSREKPTTSRDIGVTSKQGAHSTALQMASQNGTAFEVELLIGEKLRVKLHKALIASFSVSGHGGDGEGPMESWTLNAESIEFITDER
jgi:hypothetical protein